MKTPQQSVFVHHKMYQPAAEIERQYRNEYGHKNTCTGPVSQTKLLLSAPVWQQNNQNGQQAVNDQMYDGEAKIDQGMVHFFAPIT